MNETRLGPWTLHHDPAATRVAYTLVAREAPDEACAGDGDRRAMRAYEHTYPAQFTTLLRRLGIDPAYPAEMFAQDPQQIERRVYDGWFHFVGTVALDRADEGRRWADEASGLFYDGAFLTWPALDARCAIYFTAQTALVPPAFRGWPLVQLEFTVEVPQALGDADPVRP